MKKILLILLSACLFATIFSACASKSDPATGNEITGITFINKEVTYDGNEHEITITGDIPDGVNAQYTNNKGTNAGQYDASVVLSGEGYKTKTLTAKLIINKASYDMSSAQWTSANFTYDGYEKEVTVTNLPTGVTVKSYDNNKKVNADSYTATVEFNYDTTNYNQPTITPYNWEIKKATFENIAFKSQTFEYDTTAKSIEIEGTLPSGSNVEYVCEEDNSIENSATDTGTYTITATITNPNYNTLTLEAVMTIKGVEDERHIFSLNNTVYFANALHNDYLYSYDGTSVTKVSSDVPYFFTNNGTNTYFVSKSLFGNSIKSIDATSTSVTFSAKAEYLINDGSYLYYAVNALTQSNSGIYKLDLSGTEPVATKLFEGKAKYLNYYDGNIYFANGANGYKLSKLNLSNNSVTLLRDEKISTLICENGYLFYTVNNLLGDYIENFNLSNNTYKKLTIDAGTNLTLIGTKLYYVNVDLLTSYVFGDGISYVNAYPLSDTNLHGTSLFSDNKVYSSLTKINSNEIAFYRVDDQMLCLYNVNTQSIEEVLENFVKPEETPLSLGSKTLAHDNKIYYLDLYKDKTLNVYDPATDKTRKLTSNKVTDFTIIGDYLYYNSVSYLVNNDLYKVNLKNGSLELISTNDCVDIVSNGSKIFYVEKNAGGVSTAIHQIDENGEDTIMYTKGVNNLRYYDNYIYFIDGDKLCKMPVSNWVKDEETVIKDKDVDIFEIDNGVIYYREVLIINKNLSKINVDGTGYSVVVEKYDPVDIVIYNNSIYFYSDTVKASTAGIFKVNKDGSNLTEIMLKKVDETTYYPSEISVLNGDVYFINYATAGTLGDSHLYKISNSIITKVV